MADAGISRTVRTAEPGEGRRARVTERAEPPPTRERGAPVAPLPPPRWWHYLWLVALGRFVVLDVCLPATGSQPHESLTYSGFLRRVAAERVKTVAIASDGQASGGLANGVLGYLWWRMSKGAAGRWQGALGVGRSNTKVFDAERPSTTFADVAGYEGAKLEIREVVDILREADRYAKAGAKAPRGVLMVGPPGTGKMLLARAVAGEAAVPFFSVTGSSFVEMIAGVGATRVRDLFAEARKRAPAIVSVDEIDAIGQRRAGSGAVVASDEREQTLNQLLAEMDGFDPTTGVVVLAATNRTDVLGEHRGVHAALGALPLECETVDGEEIYPLAGRTPAAGGTPIGPRDAMRLTGREEHPDAGRPATVARDASAPARTALPRGGDHRSHE